MPTSVPGNSAVRTAGAANASASAAGRGFTLLELLVVLAIVAVSVATASLALRDGSATRLEREGVRLAALLEMARTESRVNGTPVQWVPGGLESAGARGADAATPVDFRFVGLPPRLQMPTQWLDPRVTAQVQGRPGMTLGPDAILPPQRVVLRLDDQRLEVASDGLSPFAIADTPAAAPR
jgi:general secretion pathway protein H